jgi:anti-anti-sigma factor
VSPENLFAVRRRAASNGTAHLDLSGEIDAYTAPILRRAVAEELHNGSRIVLDCSQLVFIDGSGLKVLEWAAAAAAPDPVEVHNASPVLRQLAAITGLDRRATFVTEEPLDAERRRVHAT